MTTVSNYNNHVMTYILIKLNSKSLITITNNKFLVPNFLIRKSLHRSSINKKYLIIKTKIIMNLEAIQKPKSNQKAPFALQENFLKISSNLWIFNHNNFDF